MNILEKIPPGAKLILDRINASGRFAVLVGGCVRDALLGKEPKDWDIACNILPEDLIEFYFKDLHVIPTGIKHGTVTVLAEGDAYEVTCFRADGEYSDGRHPDSVQLLAFENGELALQADLNRRDFTINALAFHPVLGLIENKFYGQSGIKDLKNKVICCNADPFARFSEDALRILRAMRFSSALGFEIETETKRAMHELKSLLDKVSAERKRDELVKILCGKNCLAVLEEFPDIICQVIPEMTPCVGFEQKNRFHEFDVYGHTIHAIENEGGSDVIVKMALLLHDVGKPFCYSEDEKGGHFYGHPKVSSEIAAKVVSDLRFSRDEQDKIVQLVVEHDADLQPTAKCMRRLLSSLGEEQARRLLDIKIADTAAHSPVNRLECVGKNYACLGTFETCIEEEGRFQMKDLAAGGRDLIKIGFEQGPAIGAALRMLFDAVVAEELPNEKEALLEQAKKVICG